MSQMSAHNPDDLGAADPPTDDPDAGTMAAARGRIYGLLAATFDGDVDQVATALADDTFADLAAVLPVDLNTEPLVRDDPDKRSLKIGYDNLFVVPGEHYVPPFASGHATDPSEEFDSDSPYHTAGDAGELLGDPAARMTQLYDAAGFEPDRGDGIPDHVAACFEFMRALCLQEARLTDDQTAVDRRATIHELQASTLATLGWLDQFEAAVANEDTVEGVFAGITRLARTFTAWDARDGVPTAVPTTDQETDTTSQ